MNSSYTAQGTKECGASPHPGSDGLPHNSLYRYGAAPPLPELHPEAACRGRVASVLQSTGAGPSLLHSSATSLRHLDNPNVVVTAWKLAEDGDGSIVLVEEISGKAVVAHIDNTYLRVDQAWPRNEFEDHLSSLPAIGCGVEIELKPFEVATIRMKTAPQHAGK